jgi:hypothetical protein
MLHSIITAVESFHVQQKYNATKASNAPPLNGITWHITTGYRDGEVPLVRVEGGAMTSSWATWGAASASGEAKHVGPGWPVQEGFIPATSFVMQIDNPLRPYAPLQFKVSRPDGGWFMVAACWFGAPALTERQCNVRVTSGSNLPYDLPYEPIMLSADEWARGGSPGSMSLATMNIEPL